MESNAMDPNYYATKVSTELHIRQMQKDAENERMVKLANQAQPGPRRVSFSRVARVVSQFLML
jgi:hypothetical protein